MSSNTLDSIEANALQQLQSTFSSLDSRREQKILFARTIGIVEKLILNAAPTLSLTKEMKAADDIDFLVNVLAKTIAEYTQTSKRPLLRLQGQLVFYQQIEEAGGAYSSQQVADLLGIKPDAVRKRRNKGQLIAISQGKHSIYPVFQFDKSGLVENIQEILGILHVESPVDAVQFFLSPDEDLRGDTPINVLKKRSNKDIVFRLAKQFGRHVAR